MWHHKKKPQHMHYRGPRSRRERENFQKLVQRNIYIVSRDIKYSKGYIVDDIVVAIHDVKWIVNLVGLTLCEGYKCLIMLF